MYCNIKYSKDNKAMRKV